MIDRGAEGRVAIPADQMGEPFQVRSCQGIGEEHVRPAGGRDHLRLGDGRALVLADAHRLGHPHDLGHLVGLDVRSKTVRSSCHRDHVLEVPAHQAAIDQKARAEQFGCVSKGIKRIHHGMLSPSGGASFGHK